MPPYANYFPLLKKILADKIYCYCCSIDPEYPSNLSTDALWRIRVLRYCLVSVCSDGDLVNLNAICRAYAEGILEPNDMVTVWYAGRALVILIRPSKALRLYFQSARRSMGKIGFGTRGYEIECTKIIIMLLLILTSFVAN